KRSNTGYGKGMAGMENLAANRHGAEDFNRVSHNQAGGLVSLRDSNLPLPAENLHLSGAVRGRRSLVEGERIESTTHINLCTAITGHQQSDVIEQIFVGVECSYNPRRGRGKELLPSGDFLQKPVTPANQITGKPALPVFGLRGLDIESRRPL